MLAGQWRWVLTPFLSKISDFCSAVPSRRVSKSKTGRGNQNINFNVCYEKKKKKKKKCLKLVVLTSKYMFILKEL